MAWFEPSPDSMIETVKATTAGVAKIHESIDRLVAVQEEQNALLRALLEKRQ